MFKHMKIDELCRPAKFYLYISLVGIALSILQNCQSFDNSKYRCGSFSANVPSVMLIFAFKLLYIAFWVYVINLICRDNSKRLAWLLVLFPFILIFVILGILMLTGGKQNEREGFVEGNAPGNATKTNTNTGNDSDKARKIKEMYGGFDTSLHRPATKENMPTNKN